MKSLKLVVGKEYQIKYTGQFCHGVGVHQDAEETRSILTAGGIKAIFVGQVTVAAGARNIFFSEDSSVYLMYSTKNSDYIGTKRSQEELQRVIQEQAKVNAVTCSTCPATFLVDMEDETDLVVCPYCLAEGDHSDFPDLNY